MSLERLLVLARLFSTSAVVQGPKYKLKSHSGTKKRWRSLSGGNFKRVRKGCLKCLIQSRQQLTMLQGKAGHVHLNVVKRPGRINRLGKTASSTPTQTSLLEKLLPYG